MSISIKRYLESKSTVLFEGCPVNEVNVPEKFHDVIPHSSSGQKLSERDLYFLIFEKLISSGKMIKTVTPDKVNKMEFKRFSFVLRNGKENKLILCSGVSDQIIGQEKELSFGPALTVFGEVSVSIKKEKHTATINWQAKWNGEPPALEIHLPGYPRVLAEEGQHAITLDKRNK